MAKKSTKPVDPWVERRVPHAAVDITRNTEGKPTGLPYRGATGHRCPGEDCGAAMTWGNTVPLRHEFYLVLCRACGRHFTMSHTYLMTLTVPQAPPVVEDTPW